jgi:hypothetical protein
MVTWQPGAIPRGWGVFALVGEAYLDPPHPSFIRKHDGYGLHEEHAHADKSPVRAVLLRPTMPVHSSRMMKHEWW